MCGLLEEFSFVGFGADLGELVPEVEMDARQFFVLIELLGNGAELLCGVLEVLFAFPQKAGGEQSEVDIEIVVGMDLIGGDKGAFEAVDLFVVESGFFVGSGEAQEIRRVFGLELVGFLEGSNGFLKKCFLCVRGFLFESLGESDLPEEIVVFCIFGFFEEQGFERFSCEGKVFEIKLCKRKKLSWVTCARVEGKALFEGAEGRLPFFFFEEGFGFVDQLSDLFAVLLESVVFGAAFGVMEGFVGFADTLEALRVFFGRVLTHKTKIRAFDFSRTCIRRNL